MTTNPPPSEFIVSLKPSNTAALLILVVCCLFLAVCLLYFPFKVASTGLIIVYFVLSMRQIGWLPNPNTLTQIHIQPNNKVRIGLQRIPETAKAVFLDSSVLTRFVSVLHFCADGRIYRCSVFPDSTHKEQYRKLIVYAKWHRKQSIPINSSSFEG